MNHRHVRALLRFWWLLVIGLGVALITGVTMMAHVAAGIPPKATYRSRPKYTATETLLVTSQAAPIVRTSVAGTIRTVRGLGGGSGKKSQQPSSSTPSTVTQPTPPAAAIQTLVYFANLAPHLIVSDPVMKVRRAMFGDLKGLVIAKAVNSVTTASGKYKPGNVPIVEVDATAARPDRAIRLATSTVAAFATWLARDQAKSGIPTSQRVLISALDAPTKTVSSGGPKKSLAILVAVVVFAAFLGLAILLDKIPVRVREPLIARTAAAEPAHAEPVNGADGQIHARQRTQSRQSEPSQKEELSALLADEVGTARKGDRKARGQVPTQPE